MRIGKGAKEADTATTPNGDRMTQGNGPSRGMLDTQTALTKGLTRRLCECLGHVGLTCPALSFRECGCHRHAGGYCSGILPLDLCTDCGVTVSPTRRVVVSCGCLVCESCAVDSLLKSAHAVGALAASVAADRARVRELVEKAQSHGVDSVRAEMDAMRDNTIAQRQRMLALVRERRTE